MRRRAFLIGLLAATPVASAHTPYGQWVTYRKKHLLVGCHREDPLTYDLAKRLVSVLDRELPDAKARVARAPHARRLASLMGTEQLDLAIMSSEDAADLLSGRGRFEPYGPIDAGLLAPLDGNRLLIARNDFKPAHAWLVTDALSHSVLMGEAVDAFSPGWHVGAERRLKGLPMPEN